MGSPHDPEVEVKRCSGEAEAVRRSVSSRCLPATLLSGEWLSMLVEKLICSSGRRGSPGSSL